MNVAVTYGQPASTPAHPIRATGKEAMQKNSTALCSLGISEIILGVISSVLGAIAYGALIGIWGGLVLTISGILGVTARCSPTQPVYTANLILSIFAVVAMIGMLLFSSVAAAITNRIVLCVILAILSFVAIIITVIHTTYSSVTNSSTRRPRVMYTPVPQQQQLIPVQMPNGHIMYYPAQTIPSAGVMYHSNVQVLPPPMIAPNVNQPIPLAQPMLPAPPQNGQMPVPQPQ